MQKCKYCGADIFWVKTKKGKSMPCDPIEVRYWAQKRGPYKIVTDKGDVVSASLTGELGMSDGTGYMSHFSTCANYKG